MQSGSPFGVSAASERLHLAMAAYLARYKGQSRMHAESDLRAYLTGCLEHGADPLGVSRPQVELYVRWMQEIRRLGPSTVSRRMLVMVGFYRTLVIDGVLTASPPECATGVAHARADPPAVRSHPDRRPPLDEPERLRPRRHAWTAHLRIFEACGADITDLGEEHGHRVLRVIGKGGKVVLTPLPPAVGRAIDHEVGERIAGPILRTRRGTRMDRHAATRRLHTLAGQAGVRLPRMHSQSGVDGFWLKGVER